MTRGSNAPGPGPPAGEGCPARVGPFEVERELARGGMGVVYVARSPELGRRVAVKVLLGDDPVGALRFETEARAMARLRHPNVVGVHAVGRHAGRPYYAMDLIEGESLADLIARDGPLPIREAA